MQLIFEAIQNANEKYTFMLTKQMQRTTSKTNQKYILKEVSTHSFKIEKKNERVNLVSRNFL